MEQVTKNAIQFLLIVYLWKQRPAQIHESAKLFLSHKKYYENSVSICRMFGMEIEVILWKKQKKKLDQIKDYLVRNQQS